MARGQLGQALCHLRRVLGGAAGDATDLQLLERYAATRQEEAFAALVRRHGALVLGVCRRVLGNDCDADDAFQATFLVLARKAGSVVWRESIGSWLYSVAYRIARKQRGAAALRRGHERAAGVRGRQEVAENPAALELQEVLDEELARLPAKFRLPLLLCCLQDQTLDEAAQQLGWTFATVKGRLQRGRQILRDRLRRRGVALSAGVLATILTPGLVQAIPGKLLDATIQAAGTGTTPAAVAAHVKGALQAMFWIKLKVTLLTLAVVCLLGVGAALGRPWTRLGGQPGDPAALPNQSASQKKAAAGVAPARQAAAQDRLSVRTSVSIYSGRENPSWPLTAPQAAEFLKRLKGLPKTDAPAEQSRLGYQGFYLQVSGEKFGGIDYITVFGGFVRTRGRGPDQAFLDKDRTLEKWLLDTGKGTLDPALYNGLAAGFKTGGAKDAPAPLTDQQMLALARQAVEKARAVKLQELYSESPHLGGKRQIDQPLKQSHFWCVVDRLTKGEPARSYLVVSRRGVVSTYRSEDFAKILQAEDRSRWTNADYLQTAILYIHLTDTNNQDGWKVVKTPAEFMAIEFNMLPQTETQRRQAAQAVQKPTVERFKDVVRVRLWSWHLIGGRLREWQVTFTPAAFQVESKELGRFGGAEYR
jgi:RNA polymerase sigma factor (sigma-70 family)